MTHSTRLLFALAPIACVFGCSDAPEPPSTGIVVLDVESTQPPPAREPVVSIEGDVSAMAPFERCSVALTRVHLAKDDPERGYNFAKLLRTLEFGGQGYAFEDLEDGLYVVAATAARGGNRYAVDDDLVRVTGPERHVVEHEGEPRRSLVLEFAPEFDDRRRDSTTALPDAAFEFDVRIEFVGDDLERPASFTFAWRTADGPLRVEGLRPGRWVITCRAYAVESAHPGLRADGTLDDATADEGPVTMTFAPTVTVDDPVRARTPAPGTRSTSSGR